MHRNFRFGANHFAKGSDQIEKRHIGNLGKIRFNHLVFKLVCAAWKGQFFRFFFFSQIKRHIFESLVFQKSINQFLTRIVASPLPAAGDYGQYGTHVAYGLGLLAVPDPEVRRVGLVAAVFYIAHHIIVKANLFLIVAIVWRLAGSYDLRRIGGLYKSRPLLGMLFLVPVVIFIVVMLAMVKPPKKPTTKPTL